MKKQACCDKGNVPCVRGLCVKCFNNTRKPRNRPTPHAAFDYALEHAAANLAGARRLLSWVLTRAVAL